MSDEGTRRSRMGWIASVFHPERKIARPTVAAVRALLGGRRPSREEPVAVEPGLLAEPLVVDLRQVPDLGAVGGIAKVTASSGEAVGIARVGRTSFVGYRLDEDVLREVEVELDETTGRLRIAAGAGVRGEE
jgi:hypothetical protein